VRRTKEVVHVQANLLFVNGAYFIRPTTSNTPKGMPSTVPTYRPFYYAAIPQKSLEVYLAVGKMLGVQGKAPSSQLALAIFIKL